MLQHSIQTEYSFLIHSFMSQKTASEVHEKVVALEEQTKEFRDNTREDLNRIVEQLNQISRQLAVIEAKPKCPDPTACKRMEATLADQNRRLVVIELARQRTLGEIAGIGLACTVVGAAITWLIDWTKK